MNAQEIQEIIENNRMQFGYFGIRAMTRNPKTDELSVAIVGEYVENSYDWSDRDYVDSTDDELGGTCAVGIDLDVEVEEVEEILNRFNGLYCSSGQQVALLACDHREYGDDHREIVMQNAVVLAAWTR